MPPKKPSQGSRKLTVKQKKLIELMPLVDADEMTMKDAMLKSGYAESSSDQQAEVLRSLRNNGVMQDALRKAGFHEEFIAERVMEGMEATEGVTIKVGKDEFDIKYDPDFKTRHSYLVTGAKLLDAFPAQKHDVTVTPKSYKEIEEQPRANSPAEAKERAENEEWEN